MFDDLLSKQLLSKCICPDITNIILEYTSLQNDEIDYIKNVCTMKDQLYAFYDYFDHTTIFTKIDLRITYCLNNECVLKDLGFDPTYSSENTIETFHGIYYLRARPKKYLIIGDFLRILAILKFNCLNLYVEDVIAENHLILCMICSKDSSI